MAKTNHLYPAQASILQNGVTFVCTHCAKKTKIVISQLAKWA